MGIYSRETRNNAKAPHHSWHRSRVSAHQTARDKRRRCFLERTDRHKVSTESHGLQHQTSRLRIRRRGSSREDNGCYRHVSSLILNDIPVPIRERVATSTCITGCAESYEFRFYLYVHTYSPDHCRYYVRVYSRYHRCDNAGTGVVPSLVLVPLL